MPQSLVNLLSIHVHTLHFARTGRIDDRVHERDSGLSPEVESEAPSHRRCSICEQREVSDVWRLYGVPVCRRCAAQFIRRRRGAFAIDYFLANTLASTHVLLLPSAALSPGMGDVIAVCVMSLLVAFRDSWSGGSPGKRLLGLQVVDIETGAPIGAVGSLIRNFPVAIPVLGYLLMLLAYSQMEDGPRIGDGWARTRVLWRPRGRTPPFRHDIGSMTAVGDDDQSDHQFGYEARGSATLDGQMNGTLQRKGHQRGYWAVLIVAALIIPILCALGWSYASGYPTAYRTAVEEFVRARPGEYDSPSFIAHGLRRGMTVDEVDEVMAGADETHILTVVEPLTDEQWGEYLFRYGPRWQPLLSGESGYIIEETFRVYFDEDSRVRKAERLKGGVGRSKYVFDAEIELARNIRSMSGQGGE